MSDATDFAELQRLPPAQAVSYMQGRRRVVESYGWQDLWQGVHAEAFTISRLAQADVLHAMQQLLERSVAGDLTRRDFMRDARAVLEAAGWWGEKEVVDPATGEILRTRFDAHRLKLIFDANTRQAYSAGQWERIQSTKDTHPYLRYITKRDERVRELHRQWDNLTLPVDDAFWLTHLPPNGWRCRCRVVAVNQRDYDRGVTPTGAPMRKTAPEVVMRAWENRRTGEVLQVPVGIDPGWGYNAGVARAAALGRLVQDKLVALPAPLGAAAWAEVRLHAQPSLLAQWQGLVADASTGDAKGAAALVHVLDADTLAALRTHGVELASAAVLMRDSALVHALRDTKAARGAALPEWVWSGLPTLLASAEPLLDVVDRALVFALSLPERAGKVVVRVDYAEKVRLGDQRARVRANFVQTGGVVEPYNLNPSQGQYVPLRVGGR